MQLAESCLLVFDCLCVPMAGSDDNIYHYNVSSEMFIIHQVVKSTDR